MAVVAIATKVNMWVMTRAQAQGYYLSSLRDPSSVRDQECATSKLAFQARIMLTEQRDVEEERDPNQEGHNAD
jgi:hypothetical protein